MGQSVFFLTVRSDQSLDFQPVPDNIELPTLDTGITTVAPAPTPSPTDNPFPWRDQGSVSQSFDALPESLKDAISWFFPQNLWGEAALITSCEAPNHSAATDDTRGQTTRPGVTQEYSLGSWQINLLAHPQISEEQARNDWFATSYARSLYDSNGDWSSWAYCAKANGLRQHVV